MINTGTPEGVPCPAASRIPGDGMELEMDGLGWDRQVLGEA